MGTTPSSHIDTSSPAYAPTVPVVTFAAMKGGAGKTTSTVLTAAAAARSGKTVIVADTDPQQTLTRWVEDADPPFDVIPIVTRSVARSISSLNTADTVVLVDTPPGETDQTIVSGAISASDLVIVPCAPNKPDLDRLGTTLDLVEALGIPVAVLIVRTDERWVDHRAMVEMLDDDDNVIRLETSIPQRREIASAWGAIPDSSFGYDDVWSDVDEALERLGARVIR